MLMDASTIDPAIRLDLYEIPRRMMDAVIRCDWEQYADCFTVDGIWDPGPLGAVATGRDNVAKAFRDAWDTLHWAFQGHYHTVPVSFSESQAQLRTYLFETGVFRGSDSAPPIGLGVYTDDMTLVDGKWKVARHALSCVYFGASDFSKAMHQTSLRADPA